MVKTGQEVLRCAYPGCENEPRPGEAGAEPGYCGLPDPVTGEPHTALTAFRRRQVLARQGGGVAGPEDLGRPGFAFWRYRRARAEAEAGEARLRRCRPMRGWPRRWRRRLPPSRRPCGAGGRAGTVPPQAARAARGAGGGGASPGPGMPGRTRPGRGRRPSRPARSWTGPARPRTGR